jgi:hypothetical protein
MQTPNGEGRGKKLKSLDELVASEHAAGKEGSYSMSRSMLGAMCRFSYVV